MGKIGLCFTLAFDNGITKYTNADASPFGSDDVVNLLISTDVGDTWTSVKTWTVNDNISNSSERSSKFSLFPVCSDLKYPRLNLDKLLFLHMSGKLFKTVVNPNSSINVSFLKTGIYLIKIEITDGSIQTVKALKKQKSSSVILEDSLIWAVFYFFLNRVRLHQKLKNFFCFLVSFCIFAAE